MNTLQDAHNRLTGKGRFEIVASYPCHEPRCTNTLGPIFVDFDKSNKRQHKAHFKVCDAIAWAGDAEGWHMGGYDVGDDEDDVWELVMFCPDCVWLRLCGADCQANFHTPPIVCEATGYGLSELDGWDLETFENSPYDYCPDHKYLKDTGCTCGQCDLEDDD